MKSKVVFLLFNTVVHFDDGLGITKHTVSHAPSKLVLNACMFGILKNRYAMCTCICKCGNSKTKVKSNVSERSDTNTLQCGWEALKHISILSQPVQVLMWMVLE